MHLSGVVQGLLLCCDMWNTSIGGNEPIRTEEKRDGKDYQSLCVKGNKDLLLLWSQEPEKEPG